MALGHPDAVTALSAGYGKATITAHIGVQPFTDRGLKLPGAHVITDSRKVFGTQITLLATKQTRDKNPTLFQAVAKALEEAMRWRMPISAKPSPSGRRCKRRQKASTTWSPS